DRTTLTIKDEWMPLGYSSNGGIDQSQLVFAGYGITAAELKHDDYTNVKAQGRISLVFAGAPEGDSQRAQFGRYSESRWKALAAKDHGAKALIIIASDEKFGNDRLTKLSYDQAAGEAGIPVVVVSRQIAAKWFGLADAAQLSTLEKTPNEWANSMQKLD